MIKLIVANYLRNGKSVYCLFRNDKDRKNFEATTGLKSYVIGETIL